MNHASIIRSLDNTTNQCLMLDLSLKEYLSKISSSLVSHLFLEDFVIYFQHGSKNLLKQFIKANYMDGCYFPKHSYSIEIGKGIVGASVRQKTAIIVNDTSKNSTYISEDVFRYSELVVPIIHNNRIVGVLDSENSNKNFYNEDLLHVFGLTAKLISYFLKESKSKDREVVEKKHFNYFIKLLNEKKLYLDESLSSTDIAEVIDISPAYFSHIVNKISGQTFNSILNFYRVQHVIDLLKKNEHSKRTLLSIALSAGFNSKSSFNLNFKRITLKSPSDFIDSLS